MVFLASSRRRDEDDNNDGWHNGDFCVFNENEETNGAASAKKSRRKPEVSLRMIMAMVKENNKRWGLLNDGYESLCALY